MEIIASLFAAAVVCVILFRINKTGKTDDNKVLSSSNIASNSNDNCNNNDSCNRDKCKELCLKTLKELNCEVIKDDEGIFGFFYQGARFSIMPGNGYVRIWFLNWYDIELDDIDMLAKARRLINEMNNDEPSPCITYFIQKDENVMYLRSAVDILFIREIPNIKLHLICYLQCFFQRANEFRARIFQQEEKETIQK